jgi:hypothetical protein
LSEKPEASTMWIRTSASQRSFKNAFPLPRPYPKSREDSLAHGQGSAPGTRHHGGPLPPGTLPAQGQPHP